MKSLDNNFEQASREKVPSTLEKSKPLELPDRVDKELERSLPFSTHGAR